MGETTKRPVKRRLQTRVLLALLDECATEIADEIYAAAAPEHPRYQRLEKLLERVNEALAKMRAS